VNDLERLAIAHRFSTVITGDDISDPKPAPESLEMALLHLNLSPEESLYVGDAHADFEMSRAAGVTFIGVSSEFANLKEDHPEYDVHPIASLSRVIESIK
jgi:phosphoglycolate phosphatase-like HAD superfamily hydrolase